jgi:hypothetical protein
MPGTHATLPIILNGEGLQGDRLRNQTDQHAAWRTPHIVVHMPLYRPADAGKVRSIRPDTRPSITARQDRKRIRVVAATHQFRLERRRQPKGSPSLTS